MWILCSCPRSTFFRSWQSKEWSKKISNPRIPKQPHIWIPYTSKFKSSVSSNINITSTKVMQVEGQKEEKFALVLVTMLSFSPQEPKSWLPTKYQEFKEFFDKEEKDSKIVILIINRKRHTKAQCSLRIYQLQFHNWIHLAQTFSLKKKDVSLYVLMDYLYLNKLIVWNMLSRKLEIWACWQKPSLLTLQRWATRVLC